jgi:lysophospholipase L1-like esterase
MTRGGQRIAGLLLATFGIGMAAMVMEAGVRLLHLVPDRFWEYDDRLGTRLIPDKAGWWTQEDHEFRVPVRINSVGLRDRERTLDKPPGVKRVLLIGDSYVEALQVPLEDALGPRLESRLREAGAAVEVINAGVSGYGTAGELLWFRNVGRQFDPDLVVLAFYPGNDVKNNSPTLEKALVPQYDDDGALVRVVGKKSRSDRKGWSGRSAAYTYLRKLILTRQPALASLLVRLHLMKKEAIRASDLVDGVPLDYWVYADPPPAEWADAWRRTERNLEDFRAAVEERGARFALVVVTARDQIDTASWDAVKSAYPRLAQGRWDLDGPTARVLNWCRDRGVPCVSLGPIFRIARDSGAERLHFVHDGHWTAAGHRLAADAVAEFIESETLL